MTVTSQVTARYLRALAALLLPCSLLATTANATRVTGDGVELRCDQIDARLECAYTLLEDSPVSGVTASIDGVQLPVSRFPKPSTSRTALLFMVDTSDIERQAIVERNIVDVKHMLEFAPDTYELGLATFDSDLRIEAPLGSQKKDIRVATERMGTRAPTTELYRNALDAIELISASTAAQRVLVILSDGMAEDKAYFHSDVIAAAKQSDVIIYGLGYTLSERQTVALQTLRRLAEETGGVFVQADSEMMLPKSFLADPFQRLRTTGKLSVDLADVPPSSTPGPQQVSLVWILGQGTATASVTFTPAESPSAVATQPAGAITESQTPPLPGLVPESRSLPTSIIVIGASGVVVLVALIAVAVWFFTKARAPLPAQVAEAVASPHAPNSVGILEEQENDKNRYLVSTDLFSIGRHSDNDLTLNDPSISRHHATIERRKDGSFAITDLESMNGIFVNNRQHKRTVLRDGDLIELGDVPLRFVLSEEGRASEEKTVILAPLSPHSDV